jgi:dTDP-4-dehydrorhamnose 3,5-epimerase
VNAGGLGTIVTRRSIMKLIPTPLNDAYLIELDRLVDRRGFFARVFCADEFRKLGIETRFVQINDAFNAAKGTLRGLHYQRPPSAEVKIVRCLQGAIWDVIVDLRPDSTTFGRWYGAELNPDNRLMMYAPRGFAHGMLTLQDNSEVLYLVSDFYDPPRERGIRWNDPHFAIAWPISPLDISPKDATWPDFDPQFHDVDGLRGQK